jgi:hypothetical protein
MPANTTDSGARAVQPKSKKKAVKVRAPTSKQVTQARAQEQTYASQGRSVERQANRQKKIAVRKIARGQEQAYKSQGESVKAQAKKQIKYRDAQTPPKKKPVYVKAPSYYAGDYTKRNDASVVGKLAPVLKVLDQTTRPVHAIAGAADAAVTHKPILRAAQRGIQNKDRTTFSTVLKHAGVKNKAIRGIAGFGLDVAADPLTYVTGGTSSLALKAGSKAAGRVESKALKAGLDKGQAVRAGERARNAAEKKAPAGKGVTVRVAGRDVPGVAKATHTAARPVRAAARKVVSEDTRASVRSVAADVNPNIAPAGVPKTVHQAEVRAARTARSKANQGNRSAVNLAHGIRKQIGEKNYTAVVDAIEAGDLKGLSPELAAHAHTLRSQLKGIRRIQRRAGIKVGNVTARKQVKVPAVTADVEQSAKDLAKAHRREIAAKRELRALHLEHGIAQGRAEVLSRNVSGVKAENAAARAGKLRVMAGSRAGKRGSPQDVLRYMDRVERGQKYAGGGHGVSLTQTAIHDAEERLAKARAHHETAKTAHESAKTQAASQRAAAGRAEKINAKRAKAAGGYVPRQLTTEAVEADAKKASRPGRASTKPKSSKARVETRPMSIVRAEKPGRYREDLHAVVAERLAEGHSSAALAELNQRLGSLGTAVKRGTVPAVQKGEAVYRIKAGNAPREVTDKLEVARAAAPLKLNKKGTKVKNATPKSVGAGRYVVLNKDVVKRAAEGSAPTMALADKGVVRKFDKATGVFKRIALATPGFHLRNVVGDTFQAYVRQPGTKLAPNMARSGKILHELGKQEKAQRQLKPPAPSGKTMKTGRYGHVALEDIAKNLVEAGAARSGYTARELRELSKSGSEGKLSVKRAKAPAGVKRAFLNREDLPRLATAIYHLRQGATWEEAAKAVADTHFDYGHLTSFERNFARRLMPFYTWTARNVPFTAKNVISRPGKYATYQKIREEFATATQPGQVDEQTKGLYAQLEKAGVKLPGGYERYLSEWEQRNAGVPVSWKGHKFTVSMGLPLGDLNELPGAAGKDQGVEYFQKAMSLLNPIVKNPVEYYSNFSFFFRDQIQRDHTPYVAAPSPVGSLPQKIKDELGVKRIVDKRSGKTVWGWRGKTDYLAKQLPGIPSIAQQFATPGADRRGKTMGGKVLGAFGVKSVPLDPTTNAINLAYARQAEVQNRLSGLRQQKNPANGQTISAKNPTPEYAKLNQQLKLVTQIAYQGKVARKDAVLPTSGGPPKIRSTAGGKLNGAGSSGGGSLNGAGSSGGGKLN